MLYCPVTYPQPLTDELTDLTSNSLTANRLRRLLTLEGYCRCECFTEGQLEKTWIYLQAQYRAAMYHSQYTKKKRISIMHGFFRWYLVSTKEQVCPNLLPSLYKSSYVTYLFVYFVYHPMEQLM